MEQLLYKDGEIRNSQTFNSRLWQSHVKAKKRVGFKQSIKRMRVSKSTASVNESCLNVLKTVKDINRIVEWCLLNLFSRAYLLGD